MKRFVFHPFIFAVTPILVLLAVNITEVKIGIVLRPMIVSLTGTGLILVAARLVLKDWRRAALVTTFLLILFFTYGHLYYFLRNTLVLGLNLGRHRYLLVVYGLLATFGVWWFVKKLKDVLVANQFFNLIGIVLFITPLFQITNHYLRVSVGEQVSEGMVSGSNPLIVSEGGAMPDVYYIILDTYTRADVLLNQYNFDNSQFIDELRNMDFYVADCSRSNYSDTLKSLTSALNMNYLPKLWEELSAIGLGPGDIGVLLKQSLVRKQLEAIGYKTVAFDTGYDWSRLSDADIYLGLAHNPLGLQFIEPFEAMLLRNSAALILTDSQYKLVSERFGGVNFPYSGFAYLQLYILDQLPQIALIPEPKFTFVHLLVPHVPRVFGPNGEILTDPGFYGGEMGAPINDEYDYKGYIGEIRFINSRMLEIVRTIIAQSEAPPVIVIQGDTGGHAVSKLCILNAYHLPGNGNLKLYPTITPVNTFRIIFDTYFGTDYGLLPDECFYGEDMEERIPETSSACTGE